jgi:hypothetical protein
MSVPTEKFPANRFQTCRVGYLRKLLEGMDEDTVVVIEGGDHAYVPVTARKGTALWNVKHGCMSEDWGDEYADKHDVRVNVLVVS